MKTLISCPDCSRAVSKSAAVCPQCGSNLKMPRSTLAILGRLVTLIVGTLLALIVLGYIAGSYQ